MKWLDSFNQAMDYIEEHLTEEIDYGELAKQAGIPVYYFQKIFVYMTDITLSEYIRRRRMSMAAVELQNSQGKIIDIGLKYGYCSPTAFNRAFQGVHGVSPSLVKKRCVSVSSYPALHFSAFVRGSEKLSFRLEKKEAFRILGITGPLSRELEENFKSVPEMWNGALADGVLNRLALLMDGQPAGLLGISLHHEKNWKYFIAVSSSQVVKDMEYYQFPPALWAVFSGKGTNRTLQDLERRVITEWLPSSGFDCADIPDIEVYLKADPEDCIYEYWLPVVITERYCP